VNLSVNIPVGGIKTFRAISAVVWETNEAVSVAAPTTQTGELVLKATDNAADHEVIITNASHGQASTHSFPDPGGATGTVALLETANTFTAANTFSAGITGDVNGVAMATEEGSGWAGVTAYSSEITKQGKLITTHIFIDIAGLVVSTTDLDIIGDSAAANSHAGQIITAESGQLLSGSVSCLELPATGVVDIDFYSATEGTGTENDPVGGLTETILLTKGGVWAAGDITALTTLPAANEYLYLTAGAAGTPGTYSAGQFLIELIGYEA
jgi:hypothetical protein